MIRKLFGSIRGTLWGCAATILVFLMLLTFEMALLALDLTLNLKSFSWLIAVCIGGYCGCRQARVSPWFNWTILALTLELLVVWQIPDANEGLSELYPAADPATIQWHYPTMVGLTIPAALIGAAIWVLTHKRADVRSSVNDTASGP